MTFAPDKKSKKTTVLNLLVKKKKISHYDDFVFEIPSSEFIRAYLSNKFRSLRMTMAIVMLSMYCITLVFVLKSRLDARGSALDVIHKISRLSKRNLADEVMSQRKILEAVSQYETSSVTPAATVFTKPPPIRQIKLAELREIPSNQYIASVSSPVLHKKSMSAFGAWMMDPTSSNETIYVMDHYYRNTHILSFKSLDDFTNNTILSDYEIPVQWGGTGHTVYRGHLYFNRYNSSTMCKYKFQTREIVLCKNLPKAGYGNMAPYQWAGSTDIDFAADESGLWVIYATPESNWNITIAKLNEETLDVEKMWMTNYRKRSAANAFIVNGVLYTLHRP
uniref:noelin-2-like n=1 Tax=Styela clava TaxID=7725 RepID=UPI00193AC670